MKKNNVSTFAIFFMVIPLLHSQYLQSYDYDENEDEVTVVEPYSSSVDFHEALSEAFLFNAINKNDYELTKYLIEQNPDLVNCQDQEGATPLFYAVAYGDNRILDLLLQLGAEPDLADNFGNTPLRIAVDFNQYEAAQLLLQHGANFMRPNNRGETPFDQANNEMTDIFLANY